MYGYGYSLYNRLSFLGSPLDPNASAFLTATGITDLTIQGAVNSLVVDLKKYGVWSKMKAIYPFVGGTATTHKFNLVNPADTNGAFRLSFNGGWTHSANGATPNGTNGYANSFLTPSTTLTNNNYHLSHYSRTQNIATNAIEIGALTTEATSLLALDQYYAGVSRKAFASSGYPLYAVTVNNTDTLGYLIGSRISNVSSKIYMDSVYLAQNTTTNISTLPNRPLYLSANNNSATGTATEFSNKQTAFTTIGEGLTDTEASNLYTAVQAFQTTLGRQI